MGGLPPYTYQWTFGDGCQSPLQSNASISHRYQLNGSPGYLATLRVTDSNGASWVTLTGVGLRAISYPGMILAPADRSPTTRLGTPVVVAVVGLGAVVLAVVILVHRLRRAGGGGGRRGASVQAVPSGAAVSATPGDARASEEASPPNDGTEPPSEAR